MPRKGDERISATQSRMLGINPTLKLDEIRRSLLWLTRTTIVIEILD